jgi:hypothetical protein
MGFLVAYFARYLEMVNPLEKKVRVFHIASMARSGETLLLRSLSAHSKVRVVHNLQNIDALADIRLFKYLSKYPYKKISRKYYKVSDTGIEDDVKVLILKQGVWEHRYDFSGLVLSRNPVSIYSSLKEYAHRNSVDVFGGYLPRWLLDIDEGELDGFSKLQDIEKFCYFYCRRMGPLLRLGKPVIRYEDFIGNPISVLKKVCCYVGLVFEDSMGASHSFFEPNSIGHGGIRLDAPISEGTTSSYLNNVSSEEFDFIKIKTFDVASKYGYFFDYPHIRL